MEKRIIKKPVYEEVVAQTGTVDVEVFITSDGKEFSVESHAKRYEWELSCNKRCINFPYFVEVFEFKSMEDLLEFEKEKLSYNTIKKYDSSNFVFPSLYATYSEQSEESDDVDSSYDRYYTDLFVIPYDGFYQMILDKINIGVSK